MIEIRSAGSHHWEATGLATTWSSASKPYFIVSAREGTFLEQIERNAFADATAGREPVELRLEHKADGPVLARTDNHTLHYTDVDRGLLQVALLSKFDRAAVEAVRKIESNAYGGLSVGMIVHEDHWGTASDGRTQLRTITRASLTEVSIVHRPANTQALVLSVRQENRSATGEVIEYRAFLDATAGPPTPLPYTDADRDFDLLEMEVKAVTRGDHEAARQLRRGREHLKQQTRGTTITTSTRSLG
jgi:HK97 family phage prohead protease